MVWSAFSFKMIMYLQYSSIKHVMSPNATYSIMKSQYSSIKHAILYLPPPPEKKKKKRISIKVINI